MGDECPKCGKDTLESDGYNEFGEEMFECTSCGFACVDAAEEIDEDYVGTYQYYKDEERQQAQEADSLYELGIDLND